MDSSNNIGDAEECSSNESGWTMYIASPICENNPDDDDDDDESNEESGKERKEYQDFHDNDGGDGESDDSMASDASSGPSHQGTCGTYKRSHGKDYLEHAGSKDNRSSSGNKQHKQVAHKGLAQKPKAEKEEHGQKARSSTGDVYSKGKSWKNK